MICPNCNKENQDGIDICVFCGTNLNVKNIYSLESMPTSIDDNSKNVENFSIVEQVVEKEDEQKILPQKKDFLKVNKKLILIIALIIVLIIAISFMIISKSSKNNDKTLYNKGGSSSSTLALIKNDKEVFSVSNDAGKYALFNVDGKQVTDFIFDKELYFYNGLAVAIKDGKSGVISSSGNIIIEFGKYDDLTRVGAFFKYEGKGGKSILIDSHEKKIATYGIFNLPTNLYNADYTLIVDEENEKYHLYKNNGKHIMESSLVHETFSADHYQVYEKYLAILIGDNIYIIDTSLDEVIYSFDNAIFKSPIVGISSDKEKILLKISNKYHLIENKKEIGLTDQCSNIYYKKDMLLCESSYQQYSILDEKLNKIKDMPKGDIIMVDEKSYIVTNENNGIDFYYDNMLVKTENCKQIWSYGINDSKIYRLSIYSGDNCSTNTKKVSYYDANGTKIVDKEFSDTSGYFNKNEITLVSEDDNNSYFINAEGETISSIYNKIENYPSNTDYYEVEKDSKYGLIDSKGKEVYSPIYNSISGDYGYIVLTNDINTIIFDVKNKKEIATLEGEVKLEKDYYYVKGNTTKYYIYNSNKCFYEK